VGVNSQGGRLVRKREHVEDHDSSRHCQTLAKLICKRMSNFEGCVKQKTACKAGTEMIKTSCSTLACMCALCYASACLLIHLTLTAGVAGFNSGHAEVSTMQVVIYRAAIHSSSMQLQVMRLECAYLQVHLWQRGLAASLTLPWC